MQSDHYTKLGSHIHFLALLADESESQQNYSEQYIFQRGEYYHCGYEGQGQCYHGNNDMPLQTVYLGVWQ